MRYLWLHGFASGPTSGKGQYVQQKLRERGIDLSIPDLNEPDFFGLTVTRMLARIDALAAGERELVLFGSSLGGFAAATWAATRPGRVCALVLLAPAFELAPRWAARMGPVEVERWRRSGRHAFDHYARGRKEDLSYAFLEDAGRYDPFPLPSCPTLVIQGARDDVVEPELAREFTRRMQGRARLVELPDGHELNADLPALWHEIEPFLDGTTPRGRRRST
jgi:pimeloyl-ACP methyl ester carboxylesterase